jgi:hypothetical protein
LVGISGIIDLEPGVVILSAVIGGLHMATITLAIQKKKIGQTIGIIAWIPFCGVIIGIWALYQYIFNQRIKNTLIK